MEKPEQYYVVGSTVPDKSRMWQATAVVIIAPPSLVLPFVDVASHLL